MLIVSKRPWAFKGKIAPTVKKHFMRKCYRCAADTERQTLRLRSLREMCLANELGELVTLVMSQTEYRGFGVVSCCDTDTRTYS